MATRTGVTAATALEDPPGALSAAEAQAALYAQFAPPAPQPGAFRTLLQYARPHRGVLVITLLLSLLASAAGLAQPMVARSTLDGLTTGGGVLGPVLLLLGLLIGGMAVTGLNAWLQQRTSQRVIRQVRRGLVHRLIRVKVAELDSRQPGDLSARVTSDSTLLQSAATDGLVMIVSGGLTLIAAVVLMATLHLGLLLITLGVLVVVGLLLMVVLPKIRLSVARAQESVGAVGAALERILGAARLVKANGAEARETEQANAAVDSAYEAGLTSAKYTAVVSMISGVSVQLAFLAVLGVGGMFVAAGSLSLSALIAFLLYLFYLSDPIVSLIGGFSTLQTGLGAIGRIEEVQNIPAEDDVDLDTAPAPRKPPTVTVRGVHFQYADRSPALTGVSFTARARAQTALVGPSGAGKTTLFGLLQRFYEPEQGEILLDDVDIATLPRGEVRRRLAYVEQDATTLSGTVRQNLLYSAPEATDAEIEEVLRATMLTDFVAGLPQGLDTSVGSRGVTLSGGERQRLAIARALLRRPDVLLLDEATGQLDSRNEQALRTTIARAAEQCTVLLIAHRLSTITEADQIVVLEQGQVRATGSHQSLVDGDDLYRELAATQLLTGAAK
ncbi:MULTISPECIES: ABC transporter ATP-binding protein [unclassified Crossiella]|uniref:ABC transporter ATP-binding protein n=1 Tax=unclassified Crossiella TaxID=2620835 RepID=UPI001FFF4DFD|nr:MULTISPECIES: ABC transporter ATP-binding protein [unclassified Crossiella]MCK2241651.1 ABC transporter ATP-binding protein/permease [Crossiella sp. S99.2]MCK2255477.1 ABC transporter ATP-binding protein/permease [Crossiella sp. S99.1]